MKTAVFTRLGPDDMAAVAELEARCFSSPWREDQLRAALLSPHFSAYGMKGQDRLFAYISLNLVPGEIEVLNIATHPEYRRRGLARALLRCALKAAAPVVERGYGVRAFLEVRVGNVPALGLYRSLGFARVGARKGYYRDTGEDALILRVDLSAVPAAAENDATL
ncbi:MAG: ribosomal protein S18-alanine N-acetyltransferase [Desulfovibrionaceae bacterium]|nr:ribosomal protein S18-alanine N-acetyltransferase [Desulfovibrionaceae bacterium]